MKALHIDGEPKAWFEYKRDGEAQRVIYCAFAWVGDDPAALVRHAHETVAKIEKMSYMNGADEPPVIFWRRRIECTHEGLVTEEWGSPSPEQWKVSFRVAAVPQLTSEQWASLDPKPEGEPAKTL